MNDNDVVIRKNEYGTIEIICPGDICSFDDFPKWIGDKIGTGELDIIAYGKPEKYLNNGKND